MKSINLKDSETILEEMCKRVGTTVDEIDFDNGEWYFQHTWTAAEEEEFRVWLGKFLEEKKYCSGKKRGMNMGYYEAGKIIGTYGWKTKEK